MEQSALFGRNAWFCPPSKTEAGKLAKCLATSHSDWASQVAQVGRNPPANAGDTRDTGLIPGSGRPPGEGKDNRLQYSCLENPMDRGAWWATVRGVPKSLLCISCFWDSVLHDRKDSVNIGQVME